MILSTGIDPTKVFQIPIGVNLGYFPRQTPETKRTMRTKYDIPHEAVVIGSFQKDGEGWGDGNEPKLIKGPDVLLKAMEILHGRVRNVVVLLSGPSRGYVKRGLKRLGIPYRHRYLSEYPRVGELYQCLDAYMISSREEGGPKAVLESMSAGIPLVTTRVGQAVDLVQHQQNGWMADVEDSEALAYWTENALDDCESRRHVLDEAHRTARSESYIAQGQRWAQLFDGFVEG